MRAIGLVAKLYSPPDPFRFDPRLDRLVEDLCRISKPESLILNLGSGTTRYGPHTVGVDLQAYSGVRVCADAQHLPFRDASAAGVLLRGVLEHVRSAEAVRDESLRVLVPGGFLYAEVPFLQPYHLSPEDHRRFTLPGLKAFLGTLEVVDAGVQIGPASTLAWVLRETVAALVSRGSLRGYRVGLTVAGWATYWIKHLDRLIVPAPHVAHAASAIYFLGRKRG
jgi:hypothetical protein